MLENILLGIQGACTVMNLLYMVAGLVIGIIFGALPGFSATMGVAVFVPFSYVMEPGAALLFLSGIYCGGVYGGSIPAVLIGIPGTSASVPTAFEGRALVRKGEGGHALGIVTFASAFGGFWSSVSLLFFSPLLALIALRVGPPETMMIAIFGLSVVCMLSEGNMLKGLFVGCITLVIASVGQDPVLGFPRFTFGQHELLGGFEVVSVLIGLFSIPEVFKMIKNLDDKDEVSKIANMRVDLKDFTGHIGNYIRSTIIGIIIGVIPAAGPDIAAFLSYNEARKVSRHKEEFGNGSIEGIIASEWPQTGSAALYSPRGDDIHALDRFCDHQRASLLRRLDLLPLCRKDPQDSKADFGNTHHGPLHGRCFCNQPEHHGRHRNVHCRYLRILPRQV